MILEFSATAIAASLFLPTMPTMPVMASTAVVSPVVTTVALRGDGYCPPEQYSSDPDCVPKGWRGTGRVDGEDQGKAKPSRDRFPECMNGVCRRRAALVATSEADKRNQFPDGRPRQPRHLG